MIAQTADLHCASELSRRRVLALKDGCGKLQRAYRCRIDDLCSHQVMPWALDWAKRRNRVDSVLALACHMRMHLHVICGCTCLLCLASRRRRTSRVRATVHLSDIGGYFGGDRCKAELADGFATGCKVCQIRVNCLPFPPWPLLGRRTVLRTVVLYVVRGKGCRYQEPYTSERWRA
jgi:hypothetical protein